MKPPTLKAMASAYSGNLCRSVAEGELAEFAHKFATADLGLLREAIDTYFGTTPKFPTLPELHSVYKRLEAAGAIDGRDMARAEAFIARRTPERMGFVRVVPDRPEPTSNSKVMGLILSYCDACIDLDGSSIRKLLDRLERVGWVLPIDARIDWEDTRVRIVSAFGRGDTLAWIVAAKRSDCVLAIAFTVIRDLLADRVLERVGVSMLKLATPPGERK